MYVVWNYSETCTKLAVFEENKDIDADDITDELLVCERRRQKYAIRVFPALYARFLLVVFSGMCAKKIAQVYNYIVEGECSNSLFCSFDYRFAFYD